MFKNYLKVAIRNIRKQGYYAIFNSLGIAMGIALSLVVYMLVDHQKSLDDFHQNRKEIFVINELHTTNGIPENQFQTMAPVAMALKNKSPLVESVVRFYSTPAIAKRGDQVFQENIRLVDPEFLNMFSFQLADGDRHALENPSGLVISSAIAKKYFGETPAMGKQMTILFNDSTKRVFTVQAVAAPFPDNASFGFGILANFSNTKSLGVDENNWKQKLEASFIQLKSADSKSKLDLPMAAILKDYNAVNTDQPVKSLYLDNLKDIPKHGYFTRNAIAIGSHPTAFVILGVLAFMVLAMACFNFTNYSLATSTSRFKEIGVRKVLGSSRKQLVIQFLAENMIISGMALMLSLLLTKFLFLPAINDIFDFQHLSFQPASDYRMILFLFILVTGIGILSGLYPALGISNVKTVQVFRNKQNIRGNKSLTRVLLVLQFGFSLFTIGASILASQNATFLKNLNVGYQKDKLLVLHADSESGFQLLRNTAIQHPDVLSVAGSQDQIGRTGNPTMGLQYNETILNSEMIRVSPEYIDLLKLQILKGRNFINGSRQDVDHSILINQKLAILLNLSNPVGSRVSIMNRNYEIVGLVDDFNYEHFFKKIGPCFLLMNDKAANRVLTIKLKKEQAGTLETALHNTWVKVMPDKPFEFSYQDQVYDISYNEARRTRSLLGSIAILTIIISAIGLFAQLALNISKRTKEIGMRKILGASFIQIARLMTRELFILLVIASVLFLPLTFYTIKSLFDSIYQYHIPVNIYFLILSFGVMILVAIITVSSLIYRAALANPVKSLRTE